MRPTTTGTRDTVIAVGLDTEKYLTWHVLLEIWSDSYSFRYEPGSANPYTATRCDNGLKLAARTPEALIRLVAGNHRMEPVRPGVTVPATAGENLNLLRERGPEEWEWWYTASLYHGKPPGGSASTVKSDTWDAALNESWNQARKAADDAIARTLRGNT